jgi:hypothetical protein
VKEIYQALVKAQSQIRIAIKDSNNPHFRSKYADLASVWDAIRDALHKNGLAVLQLSDVDASGVPVLLTRIIHESGQHVEGRYPIVCKDPQDPQKMVAATTYARRASLSAALGVIADDDDGNTAAGHTASHTAPPSPVKPVSAPTTAKATGNAMTDLFAAHKLEYPKAVEDLIGKPVKEWSENDKTTAREAIKKLQAGTPWSQITKDKVFS